MTFDMLDAWWWPFLFILIAGWAATDLWRIMGVLVGNRIAEDSDIMVLVRSIATALVAAVIGNLIVFPSGALADTSIWLRLAAASSGFAAYLITGKKMVVGIVVSEVVLAAGLLAGS